MATLNGVELSQAIRQKVGEFKHLAETIDETTASHAPEGRWSPKMVVSHLCGREGSGHMQAIKAFLEKDVPRIDIVAEDPFFTEKRASMTLSELLYEFEREYSRMADLVAGLSKEQLDRKAHVPLFKDLPMGEYPTLADYIEALADMHVSFHIGHLGEILQALGVKRQGNS